MKKLYIVIAVVALIIASAAGIAFYKIQQKMQEQAELVVKNAFKELAQLSLVEGAFFSEIQTGMGYVDIQSPRFILNDGLSKIDLNTPGKLRVSYNVLGDKIKLNTSDPWQAEVIMSGQTINKVTIVPDQLNLKIALKDTLKNIKKSKVKELLEKVEVTANHIDISDAQKSLSYKIEQIQYTAEDAVVIHIKDFAMTPKAQMLALTSHKGVNELISMIEKSRALSGVDFFIKGHKKSEMVFDLESLKIESPVLLYKSDAKFDLNEGHMVVNMSILPKEGFPEMLNEQYAILQKAVSLLEDSEDAATFVNFVNENSPTSKLETTPETVVFIAKTIDSWIGKNRSKDNFEFKKEVLLSLDAINGGKMSTLNHVSIGTKDTNITLDRKQGQLYELSLKNYKGFLNGLKTQIDGYLRILTVAGQNLEPKLALDVQVPEKSILELRSLLSDMATAATQKEDDLIIEIRKGLKGLSIGTKPAGLYLAGLMAVGAKTAQAIAGQIPQVFVDRFETDMVLKYQGEFGEPDFKAEKVYTFKLKPAVAAE